MRRSRRGDAQLEVSVTHSGSGTGTPSPTVTPTPLVPQSELWADTPEMDSELDLDQSFTEHPSDGDYSQSPVKRGQLSPCKATKSSLHSPPCSILVGEVSSWSLSEGASSWGGDVTLVGEVSSTAAEKDLLAFCRHFQDCYNLLLKQWCNVSCVDRTVQWGGTWLVYTVH